ncbi:hypothetical protein [Geodermatophilus arenarius]|uniref:Uncharacterized protein n=1 Tax=Geodermatophilus arenarius TaxID=1137990 RepID=A0ABV9LHK6_9ACTN
MDRVTLRWRPDGTTVDVRLPGLNRSHPRPQHVATFRVRPVDRAAAPQDTAPDPDPVDAARRAARDANAAALAAIREVLGDQPVRMAGVVEQAVRRALLAAHDLGREEGWRACAVEHYLPTD